MRRRNCRVLAAVVGVAAVAGGVWGQVGGGFDVEGLLVRLENAGSAGEARAAIEKLPEGALGALYDALGDPTLAAGVREALGEEVTKLHGRIWRERKEAGEKATAAWAEATGAAVFRAEHPMPTGADGLALAAIEGAGTEPLKAYGLAKAAVDGGSEDALVLYYYVTRMPEDAPEEEWIGGVKVLLKAMEGTKYPASRQIYMLLRSAAILGNPKSGEALKAAGVDPGEGLRVFNEAIGMLPAVAAEKPSEEDVRQLVDLIDFAGGRVMKGNKALLFNRTFEAMNRAFPKNSTVLGYAAEFYASWAWQSQADDGEAFLEETKQFQLRLKEGEKYAREAIAADPAGAEGPTAMIEIAYFGDEEGVSPEAWFQRAMNANPDNYKACSYKLMYLLPMDGGPVDAVLNFGRACVEHGTGLNRIPLILVDVHEDLRRRAGNQDAYMRGADVWPDIQEAYEKVVTEEEGKVAAYTVAVDRAKYLKYAAECGAWGDFAALAKRFGEGIDMETFGGKALLEFYKQKAAEAAKGPV